MMNKLIPATNPIRLITPLAVWQKMMAYVQACPDEINGFGYIQITGENTLYLSDVFILEQTVSGVSTDVDDQALHRHINDMVQAGINTALLRFQWHSHVYMPAFFSATDDACIARYPCEWMVSLVTNKYGEYQAQLDIYRPFKLSLPITVELELSADNRLSDNCSAEVSTKVTRQEVGWFGHVKHAAIRPDDASTPYCFELGGADDGLSQSN
ncbi:Mov34/MPN/PAD-1 family protein [Candidatus Saccharibacteria bacterium]|nr:Mov34/MPN/PAD-1 family protein [Candidatus Saccharibacteria bacterium]